MVSSRRTKRSRVFPATSCCLSFGKVVLPTGADCGEDGSMSSKKGLVEVGRSGRPPDVMELEGDNARLRNGLLEPKLTGKPGDA